MGWVCPGHVRLQAPRRGSVPALGGDRMPIGYCAGEVCAGPWREQDARRGLCRPWKGIARQERAVPAPEGYRLPGGGCAGLGRV